MSDTEDESINPWQTLSTRIVYDNPWIRVREDQVIRPDGNPGIYGVIHYKNRAIGVLAIDAEGYGHLVGQYRYVLNRYSWEIPEGGCTEGEEPLRAAQRELVEETGLEAKEWKPLGESDLSNSTGDERAFWFLATDLIQGEAEPEGSELLKRKRVPLEEALRMVERQDITDAMSIIAIFHWARLKESGRL